MGRESFITLQITLHVVGFWLAFVLVPVLTWLIARRRGLRAGPWTLLVMSISAGLGGVLGPWFVSTTVAMFANPHKDLSTLLFLLALGIMGLVLRAVWRALGRRLRPVPSRRLLWPVAVTAGVVGLAFGINAEILFFQRIAVLGERPRDQSKLRRIGAALNLYYREHGSYPQDLYLLVDGDYVPPEALVSRLGTAKVPPVEPGTPYRGPTDFNFVQLPHDAPPDLVWVWQDPKNNQWEGAFVLYKSGRVVWERPETVFKEVAKTYAWRKPAASQPASGPAG